jgi:hypothetical protein
MKKIKHTAAVSIAGDDKYEIAGILYDLVMRHAGTITSIHVEGADIEIKTLENIRSRVLK